MTAVLSHAIDVSPYSAWLIPDDQATGKWKTVPMGHCTLWGVRYNRQKQTLVSRVGCDDGCAVCPT